MAYHPKEMPQILASRLLVRRDYDCKPQELADSYISEQKEIALILPAIAKHTVEEWGNIEDLTREFKEVLIDYRWDRMWDVTLPLAFKKLWWSIKYELRYGTTRPFRRFYIWAHKRLNTKRGQAYKKARL